MKLATWNVNSLKVRLPHLLDWLQSAQPDVVCLQETKQTDDVFPVEALREAGYDSVFSGQKTYNGVAILSRWPMSEIQTGIPGFADEQKRVLAATIGGVRIVCVYIPNGQSLDSDKFVYKLAWLDALIAWLEGRDAAPSQAGLAGRLQHRAGRPRLSRSRRLGRASAGFRTGTPALPGLARSRSEGCISAVRTAREKL
jgi:exodeoxyribonuclease III